MEERPEGRRKSKTLIQRLFKSFQQVLKASTKAVNKAGVNKKDI